jgi:hypothetical protein
VDLVHDRGAHGREHPALSLQRGKRFRRRDQDVRRPLRHRRALAGQRVARATCAHRGLPSGADLGQRPSSAFVAFGEHMLTGQQQPSSLGQAWHINPLEERVDGGEEGGQGLA